MRGHLLHCGWPQAGVVILGGHVDQAVNGLCGFTQGDGMRVTTLPGEEGVPRWSCDPCQKRRVQPLIYAGRASRYGKSGRQIRDP